MTHLLWWQLLRCGHVQTNMTRTQKTILLTERMNTFIQLRFLDLGGQFAFIFAWVQRVQRRALSIISPELSYHDSLDRHGLASLYDRRMKLCTDLFLSVSNPSHKLYNLLPDRHFSAYNTRHRRVFNMPRFRTDRFKFSFIPAMCACANLDF